MNQLSPAPDADDYRLEERHFVEDFSLYFEQMGYPRHGGADPGLASDLRPTGAVGW